MGLVILQWNARGLKAHCAQLKHFLSCATISPDIICIEETFLKDKNDSPTIDGYGIVRKDCITNDRGGLATYVKVGLNFTILNTEEIPHIETQGIEIKTSRGHIQIVNTYITPSHKVGNDLAKIFRTKRTIIVGDLNAHNAAWGCTHTNDRGDRLEQILMADNLTVLNTGQPTHIVPTTSKTISVIDLAIATQDLALSCRHSVLNTNLGSDHLVTVTHINEEIDIEVTLSMHSWKLKRADWKVYKENSKYHITEGLLDDDNSDTFNNFIEALTNLANTSIPRRVSYKNNKNKKRRPLPYWSEKCSEAIYKRNKLRNKMQKSRELTDCVAYKQQEAVVKKTLKSEARACWANYCSDMTNETKLATVWNMARRMNGIASNTTIPTLTGDSITAETNFEKANLLAATYANTSSHGNYTKKFLKHLEMTKTENDPQPETITIDAEIEALNADFTLSELKDAIRSVKCNKSPGDDRIPYELLKHLHRNALQVLLAYYNKVWKEGDLPDDWHHATIVPLLKPTKTASLPESYRPISLTSTICKVMEKMVTSRLQWFVEKNNLLSKNQTGFRKNKSTIHHILRLQDYILKKLKNKESVLAVFIDFERAYDMLHVPTLLHKLQNIGITGHTFNWIESFLSNRTFQVKVGAELSDKYRQENGTPQGSIISPLLFLLMINDIPPGLRGVDMTLFADDSAIYVGQRNIKILEEKIQSSLNAIHEWCDKNGFKISINKTTAVLFSYARSKPKINLKIGEKSIQLEKTAKFLGVVFDNKLTWNAHIKYIVEKCKRRLNLMRAVSGYTWGASKRSLKAIYRTLVRPILEYGDIAFATASKTALAKLTSIQTEALRLCCGAAKGTPASALQNECGEIPLHLRYLQNALKFSIKIKGSAFSPVSGTLQPHWTNEYRTRHSKFKSIYTRTSEFLSAFNTPCKGPSFSQTPPWLNKPIKVNTSLRKSLNKKVDHPDCMKQLVLEIIEKYQHHTHIYTDGSKAGNVAAAAFAIPTEHVYRQMRVSDHSSAYAAELTAIKEAMQWIAQNESETRKYVIFSDSLSVLTSLKRHKSKSRPTLLGETMEIHNSIALSTVEIVWTPSHVDIHGNEIADKLAKESLSITHINSTKYIEISEVYPMINSYIINKWQMEYTNDQRGSFYKALYPTVSTDIKYLDSNRKKEVQLTRLRLGHVNLNNRMYQLKIHPTGLCDMCKVQETPLHLLLQCHKEHIAQTLREKCTAKQLDVTVRNILCNADLQTVLFGLIERIYKGRIL